ncbi:MAG: DnaA regulatory inactivator Hda [Pseudomonadota bacterium]
MTERIGGIESHAQLALPFVLHEHFSFDNFHTGPNQQALDALRKPNAGVIYVLGASGSGKTHLLQAVCRDVQPQGSVAYLDAARFGDSPSAWLAGLANCLVVCIDNIEKLPGDDAWQLAMIDLYHQIEEQSGRLIVASSQRASELAGKADLRSRLSAALTVRLNFIDDDDRGAVLRERAAARGFELPSEVTDYVLLRLPRDMHALFAFLDLIDRRTLVDRRRVTVPYVRGLLERWSRDTNGLK